MARRMIPGNEGATVTARVIATTLAVGLAAPATLLTAPTEAHAFVAPTSGKDLDAARKLYDEGKSFFDTSQYEKAAEIWTRAYGMVPDDAPGVKNAMVYNIATAQEKAYVMDRDIVHLRQAEQLLRTYVENYKVLYDKTPQTKAEVDKANARIRDLQKKIKQAESGVAPTPATAEPAPAPATGTPMPAMQTYDGIQWSTGSTAQVDKKQLAENRRLASESKKTDTLIIAGYVVGSIGLFFLLVGATGFGAGAAVDSTGAARTSRGVGFGGVALGVAGVAAGATLLGVGFTKRKAIRERRAHVSPFFGRRMAGVGVGFRF